MDIYRLTTADAKKSLLDDYDSFDDKQFLMKEFDLLSHEDEDSEFGLFEDLGTEDSYEELLKEFNI